MSWGWILFWIWAGGYPFFVLPIARLLLRDMRMDGRVGKVDLVFGSALALLLALFWPLAIPIRFVMSQLTDEAREEK